MRQRDGVELPLISKTSQTEHLLFCSSSKGEMKKSREFINKGLF